jgi:predicted PhzF superfamily epimerase YddE/YHI9
MEYTVIDTFANDLFSGATAAVLNVNHIEDTTLLANISLELNLSNVVFLKKRPDEKFTYRCFCKGNEIKKQSHGLLGAIYFLANCDTSQERQTFHFINDYFESVGYFDKQKKIVKFKMPLLKVNIIPTPDRLSQSVGTSPLSVCKVSNDCLIELNNQESIQNIKPDFNRLKNLDFDGAIATSEANDKNFDFVFRYFSPKNHIDEEVASLKQISGLTDFWRQKIIKNSFKILQLSPRKSFFIVEVTCSPDDHILITGNAVKSFTGKLLI